MTAPVTLPLWLFVLILVFAATSFASNFLFPSIRWFFRLRAERVVARLNQRLERPIEPFKLARRYDLIQRLIYDPEVTEAIVAHARSTGEREDVAFQRARRYAREIVPSFSAFGYFSAAVRAARWLSTLLYDVRLEHDGSALLRDLGPDTTVIFVMNHRSNMDYVLVTYLSAERSALSYAVGEWAHVWPLSGLIRATGAYFIRRKSLNPLYRRVLSRYVQMATAGGVTQAVFPEGGLSLDGGLRPPKLGLLKYVVDGLDLGRRDVVFVPVALNYDRVLEDRVLIAAAESGPRRFRAHPVQAARSALRIIGRKLTGRFERYGSAVVRFGAPMSMRDTPGLAADPEALAGALMDRIAALVPVTPVPLVAHVLLTADDHDRAAVLAEAAALLAALPAQNGATEADRRAAAETGLDALLSRGIAQDHDGRVTLAADQRPLAAFYARSIAHLLADPRLAPPSGAKDAATARS